MEYKENDVGRFLLCLVTDANGKRHRLFFPEENGMLNGWTVLAKALKMWELRQA